MKLSEYSSACNLRHSPLGLGTRWNGDDQQLSEGLHIPCLRSLNSLNATENSWGGKECTFKKIREPVVLS